MAAEVPVSLLWRKLQKMRDEERFVFPGLRNRVVTAVNELEKILHILKASKPNHEIISISPQETSLLRRVSSSTPQEASLLRTIYFAEHFTESFLLQRRRKGVIQIEMPLAFSPWTQLWFSFKMMKLVQGVRAVSMEFGMTQGQSTALSDGPEIHAGQRCRRCHRLVGELVARLINDNEASLRVISLVSEEVLREEICFTTLAREVYDRPDIQQHFRSRAWLKVSRDPEYKNLLLALLKQLPSCVMHDLEHMNEKELCAMLFQFLMEDRFLIVLDDVQTVDVWLKLVRPFADAVNGSRVILTTHNIDVAKQADPWSSPLEPSPLIEQEPDAIVVGRKDEIKELVSRLINHNDDSLHVISVIGDKAVGDEAVGKTALARNVYNRLDIRQHFPWRAWLHVSGDLEYKDLLLIILKQLPTSEFKDLDLMGEEELSNMLFKYLMEPRFLIVLDDVQDQPVDVWHKLFRCFGDAVNGSRVILTTRNFNIAIQADPWSSPLKLGPLTEGNSWSLFSKKVGRPEYCTELNNFRGDILRICDGLPLAIVLLGGFLSALEFKEWSGVIENLRSQSPLANIVDFGYDQLPYVLKPCFLYLALFPKAYEIPIRRLLQLWLAEGFVQLPDGRIPEDEAKRYLEELVCRNMIEIAKWKSDGSPKTCTMPTYLYDDFLPKANDIGFLHVHHWKTACTSTGSPEPYIPRLADKFRVESSTSKSHIRQLRSYVSFNSEKRDASNSGIGKFLKTMIKRRGFVLLKVLDLEGVYKPLLPKKLGKLQNLRYLGLRWTGLDTCPESVGDLPCLETLDLKYTNITTLPSSIWKAKKLRHLYMNEMFIQKPPKEPLTNLLTLMELHIGANCPYKYKLDEFKSLRKLGLTCHSKSAWETAKCISKLGNLQTLKLKSRDPFGQPVELVLAPMKEHRTLSNLYLFGEIKKKVGIYICKEHRFPLNLHLFGETGKENGGVILEPHQEAQKFLEDGIHNVPRNLRTLTLSMSGLEDDPMPVLGKLLPQLNTLRLFVRSYVKSDMACRPADFPNLRVLKMWKLEELERWKVEPGAMPRLVELEIRCCEKLESSVELEKLDSLKELILTNMPQDFVEDIRTRMQDRGILLTNKWEFSTSHVKYDTNTSKEERRMEDSGS